MDLQQQQLQQLSDWLSQTEERIMKIETEPPAKDLGVYKERIEQHKVNSLSLAAALLTRHSCLVVAAMLLFSCRLCRRVICHCIKVCPLSPPAGASERPGGGAGEGELADAHGGGGG